MHQQLIGIKLSHMAHFQLCCPLNNVCLVCESLIEMPTIDENALSPTLSLAGEWQITIGTQQGPIQVPGAWEVQGYPHDVEEAIYRRIVDVPAQWSGARISLCFEAVSYHITVLVNGIQVGEHEGLWTAFTLDVGHAIRPGVSNQIELHIVKPGKSAYPHRDVLVGFIPYVATTFGGPWQAIWLIRPRRLSRKAR